MHLHKTLKNRRLGSTFGMSSLKADISFMHIFRNLLCLYRKFPVFLQSTHLMQAKFWIIFRKKLVTKDFRGNLRTGKTKTSFIMFRLSNDYYTYCAIAKGFMENIQDFYMLFFNKKHSAYHYV